MSLGTPEKQNQQDVYLCIGRERDQERNRELF